MFRNYFKITWRYLLEHRFYSIINILGMSIGITFVLLITAYIQGELSVNKTIPDEKNIYLMQSREKYGNNDFDPYVPIPLVTSLKNEYPNLIRNYCRWTWKSTTISYQNNHFRDNIEITDTTFLSFFGFHLLFGNPATAFNDPNSVILTSEKALKLFNTTNAIGKVITIENNRAEKLPFVVTGVLEPLPPNSVTATAAHDKATNNSIFIPLAAGKNWFDQANLLDWNSAIISYVELSSGIVPSELGPPITQAFTINESAETARDTEVRFLPLSEAYLDSNNGTVRSMIYTLMITAVFILLMAIVNFVNISIGNSTSRLREIGLRKVFGSAKRQLMIQFILESIVIVFISVLFSLIFYQILRSFFGQLTEKNIPSIFFFPIYYIALLIAFILLVGVLAGIYPATVLSSLKAAEAVKGKMAAASQNVFLRKTLIVFQFCTAFVVFISAIVISKQLQYNMNTDLGFDKEAILNIWLPRKWTLEGVKQMQTLRDEITTVPGVKHASVNYTVPGWNSSGVFDLYRQDQDSDKAIESLGIVSDDKYATTFNIPIKAGTFFSDFTDESDSESVVINETLAKDLGWSVATNAIGKILRSTDDMRKYTISGVIEDFHLESKQQKIKPLVFFNFYRDKSFRFLSVKMESKNVFQISKLVEKKWHSLLPNEAFDGTYLNDTLTKTYQSELELESASYLATILSIIIVLLGVTGIISLNIIKRTKEVGIRKVMGASALNIIKLFFSDMLCLIAIASVISFPIAYVLNQSWLNNYVYRVVIGTLPFLTVLGLMILITLSLISMQTFRIAFASPVKSLRAK